MKTTALSQGFAECADFHLKPLDQQPAGVQGLDLIRDETQFQLCAVMLSILNTRYDLFKRINIGFEHTDDGVAFHFTRTAEDVSHRQALRAQENLAAFRSHLKQTAKDDGVRIQGPFEGAMMSVEGEPRKIAQALFGMIAARYPSDRAALSHLNAAGVLIDRAEHHAHGLRLQ